MAFKLGMMVDLCMAYNYADARFDDLGLDTRSQWISRVKQYLSYMHSNCTWWYTYIMHDIYSHVRFVWTLSLTWKSLYGSSFLLSWHRRDQLFAMQGWFHTKMMTKLCKLCTMVKMGVGGGQWLLQAWYFSAMDDVRKKPRSKLLLSRLLFSDDL